MPEFVVCNDFAALRADVQSGKIDVFLWEVICKHMSKSGHARMHSKI